MNLIPTWKARRLPAKEMRSYYSKIRKEALRRLSVLERNNYLYMIDDVPEVTTARGRSNDEVFDELKELNKFLKNPFSKISYVKDFENTVVDKLQERYRDENGISHININRENVRDYNTYMNQLRDEFEKEYKELRKLRGNIYNYTFDSDRPTEVFSEMKRLNVNYSIKDIIDNMEYLADNLFVIGQINPVKGNRPMSQRELKKRVTQWINRNSDWY